MTPLTTLAPLKTFFTNARLNSNRHTHSPRTPSKLSHSFLSEELSQPSPDCSPCIPGLPADSRNSSPSPLQLPATADDSSCSSPSSSSYYPGTTPVLSPSTSAGFSQTHTRSHSQSSSTNSGRSQDIEDEWERLFNPSTFNGYLAELDCLSSLPSDPMPSSCASHFSAHDAKPGRYHSRKSLELTQELDSVYEVAEEDEDILDMTIFSHHFPMPPLHSAPPGSRSSYSSKRFSTQSGESDCPSLTRSASMRSSYSSLYSISESSNGHAPFHQHCTAIAVPESLGQDAWETFFDHIEADKLASGGNIVKIDQALPRPSLQRSSSNASDLIRQLLPPRPSIPLRKSSSIGQALGELSINNVTSLPRSQPMRRTNKAFVQQPSIPLRASSLTKQSD